jgi:uncharacterized OB-fold protein
MGLSRALDATPSGERERIDYATGRLAGSRCTSCGAVSWPARPVCQRCGSAATEDLLLSDRGELATYTKVWVPRPGLTPPYVLGQVDLADGVRVFAHGRGLPDGAHVPLAVRIVVDADRAAVPPFWFEPLETP